MLATLIAALPWQTLRTGTPSGRLKFRTSDLRVTRHKPRSATLTIFAVDASGSQAAHRLAEAKGAVELLLADCYARRDEVAVLGFRGTGASILLPPTRSLVRAKRALAGLPGGGGTPLATGLDLAAETAEAARRRGASPAIVLLTDGRANVARDGKAGRAAAEQDAQAAARRLRRAGHRALLIDTSPRPGSTGRELALAMDAHYLALPAAGAAALSRSVQAVLS